MLTGVQKIASTYWHSCALKTDGTVACWGGNGSGQLGDNTTMDRNAPVVPAIDGVADIAVGSDHTCAIKTGGTGTPGIYCWGSNSSGQLGTATAGNTLVPTIISTTISPLPVQISAGSEHTCVRFGGASGGAVKCWGDDYDGELGDGHMVAGGPSPVAVVGLADATWISTRTRHNCAVRNDGTVVCWGSNDRGQLGDATSTNRSQIVTAKNLTGIIQVECGDESACAITSDGKVSCWGSNSSGQLGQGTVLERHALNPAMATCP
jgi:alpha-tubulin suppressor-like RCC1 family protein